MKLSQNCDWRRRLTARVVVLVALLFVQCFGCAAGGNEEGDAYRSVNDISGTKPTRVGANYTHWQLGCSEAANHGILQTYHLPGVRDLVQRQLLTMKANGLTSLRFMIWHMREESQTWGVISSAGGSMSPQHMANWQNFCNDVRSAGYSVLEVVLGPTYRNNPQESIYDETRFQENWSFLHTTVSAALMSGVPLRVDILNEGAPHDYDASSRLRLTAYITDMWRNFVRTFGASRGTVSIAGPGAQNWDPGRLVNLYNIFSSVGAFPGFWEIHPYYDTSNALLDTHSFLSARGRGEPIVVGETFYDDLESAQSIRRFAGRRVADVFVWPLTRPEASSRPCDNWNVSPPYEDGAYSVITDVRSVIAGNSFETETEFSGWISWQNCSSLPAETSPQVFRYYSANDRPLPSGGSYSLRMRSTAFLSRCLFPGVYALSPAIAITAGATYQIDNYSRNGSASGNVTAIFYNSTGAEVSVQSSPWSLDAWTFNGDPPLVVTAPSSATSLRVRYGLLSSNSTIDLDLLSVSR